ncbi:MAG TPA: response regulator [Candidatus Angelobacter sp.]|nr:response regulator [Candidatus Angelobacter sp.]
MTTTTILIAEDNAVNRELLREMLEAGDYRVVEAKNGQEALTKIEEAEPDLVLLDINMPVMDGFAVIRWIREHPKFRKLPVVAVTAYAMKEDRERMLNAGFNGYVAKPIEFALLFKEIRRLTTCCNSARSSEASSN